MLTSTYFLVVSYYDVFRVGGFEIENHMISLALLGYKSHYC